MPCAPWRRRRFSALSERWLASSECAPFRAGPIGSSLSGPGSLDCRRRYGWQAPVDR